MKWYNLEDQYTDWLEQTCRCESEKDCECMTFNEWINDRIESMFEGVSSEEELYG